MKTLSIVSPRVRQSFSRVFDGILLLMLAQCAGKYDINPTTPLPSIQDVAPLCGSVGDTITITGKNFSAISAQNTVRINGIQSVVYLASDTYLKAIVPSRVGSGVVTVAVNDAVGTGPMFNNVPRGTVTIADTYGFVRGETYIAEGIAADASKNIYTARPTSGRIERKTPTGTSTLYAGGGDTGRMSGYGNDPGNVLFNYPLDVAADSKGNVFVADAANACIRKIDPNGTVSLYAGVYDLQYARPIPGYKDGLRTEAFFSYPRGLAIDKNDNLYVVDADNARIRKITPDNGNTLGKVTTIAGNGSIGGKDGAALQASFSNMQDVAIDGDGNLFVTELQEYPKIRKVLAAGVVTTLVKGYDDVYNGCHNKTFKLANAMGIVVDTKGTVYSAVYAGRDDNTPYAYKVIALSPDNAVNVVAGGGTEYDPIEGVGEKAYMPYAGSLIMIDDVLYLAANTRLLRIDLN